MILAAPSYANLEQLSDRASKGFRCIEVKTTETLLSQYPILRKNLREYAGSFRYVSLHAPTQCQNRWVNLADGVDATLIEVKPQPSSS